MIIRFNRLLLGTAVLAAMGIGQPGWAQQDSAHANHTGHVQQDAPAAQQDTDAPQTMQQRQGGGQGNMMQQRQGDGQGNMMQQRQGDGQGNMMQQRQGDGQGGMMQGQGNGEMMQRMQQMMRRMGGQGGNGGGQDAFSAIRTVVEQLEANPDTDWSRINIDALRNHLIDMQEVTINAAVETSEVKDGATYRVTGADRTLEAIRRMVPTHTSQINTDTVWTAVSRNLSNGVEVTVTADSPDQVAKIRALGFMGFMVEGDHHDRHHMAIVGADMDSMAGNGGNGGGHNH